MAIANPFQLGKVVDLSSSINIIPNHWGLINQLGIFKNEPKAQKTVLIPRTTETVAILTDRNWDERNNAIKAGKRDAFPVMIPHFPVDDHITPNDVDGQVDWDSLLAGGNATLSVEKVRAEKMKVIRNSHALTLEYARAQLLRDGSVYAPNGTVVTNFYTELGLTREVEFLNLASTTVSPLTSVKAAYGFIQDSLLNGQIVTNVVALCSPEFFTALITNPFVVESYQYFQQNQGAGILNQRLSSGGFDGRYEVFHYGGITFIECRGGVAGTPYIEAGKAYAFPMNTDSFRTYYAPANRFDTVNKTAMESYYFEKMGEWQDKVEIMSETNFLNAMLRPQIVITLNMAAS